MLIHFAAIQKMINAFRAHKDGLLRTHDLGPTLPTRSQTDLLDDHFSSEDLVAGDMRAIEQPGLASLHSLFLNEHNRIAREISEMNEGLDDEEIYQQAEIIILGFDISWGVVGGTKIWTKGQQLVSKTQE